MIKSHLLFVFVLALFCSCNKGTTIYVPAEDVEGASIGSPVTISGLQVGTLVNVALDIKKRRTCWLTLNIDEEYPIGSEADFYLKSISILGAKAITIENSLAGETINNGDSLRKPVFIKSLLDSYGYGSPIDSTGQAEQSEKMEELYDVILKAVQEKL